MVAAIIIASLAALISLRGFAFYPGSGRRYRCLGNRDHTILSAIGEVLLPEGGEIPLSANQAGVIEYLDDYLYKIPARQRRLIKLLLFVIEQGTLVLTPSLGRLSDLPAAKRTAYLAGWEDSPLYFRRMAFTSLRAMFTMAYLANTEVLKAIGAERPQGCGDVIPRHRGVDHYAGVIVPGGDWKDSADAVIVGSGPGGAVAARELAELGRSVVVIEEGPIARRGLFTAEPGESMHRWCREDGLSTAIGNVFLPTISARCLGGTSVINSAICSRPLPSVFSGWQERHGTYGIDREILDPLFDRLAGAFSVRPTEEPIQGRRNTLFRTACHSMGYSHLPMDRAEISCGGCAECFTGCPTLAKQSMDIACIPAAVKAGARVYTQSRVEQIVTSGRNVTAVRGSTLDGAGRVTGNFEAAGKIVLLSAGPTSTPLILLKSGVVGASGQVGRNLQFHPGAAIAGIFPEPVNPWDGANQGYQSLEFLEEGIKLEVLWSPLAILAVRFPCFGLEHKSFLARARYFAPWDTFVLTRHSFGAVKPGGRGDWRPRLSWNFDPRDAKLLQRGLAMIAEMFFAAGAEMILPGINGVPKIIRSRSGAQSIKTAVLQPADFIVAATHVFGTTRMGGEPESSVVDTSCRFHGLENLYVCDAGVLPEGTGVNPMFTVMALSLKTAGVINSRL